MRTNRGVQFNRAIAVGAQALRFQILFLSHIKLEPSPKSMVAHFISIPFNQFAMVRRQLTTSRWVSPSFAVFE